jgi:hypothetical protein
LKSRRVIFATVAVVAAALVALALFAPGIAHAAEVSRVAVYFEGKGAAAERAALISALPDRIAVVDATQTDEALRKAGLHGKLSTLLAKEDRRKRASRALDKATKSLGADAILVGTVQKTKGDRDVPVLVVRRGGEADFETVSFLKKDSEDARAAKWTSFVGVAFPAPPEPEAEPKTGDTDATPPPTVEPTASESQSAPERDAGNLPSTEERARQRTDHALATVGIAYDSGYRSFTFNDPVTGNLRPYHVGGTPGIFVSTELYPLARTNLTIARDLGVVVRFSRAFAFDSSTSDGGKSTTTWQELEAGLRYRIRTGKSLSAPLLGVGVSYVNSSFEFDQSGNVAAAELPGARYGMLRGAFDARVPIGPVALLAEASYLQVLSVDPVSTRFPRESVHGVGGRLGAAVPLLPWLEARLEARYDRLFYKLNPEPGDAYVAGGALDQHFSITAGAFVTF